MEVSPTQRFDELIQPIQCELEERWGTSGWSQQELEMIQEQTRTHVWQQTLLWSRIDHESRSLDQPWGEDTLLEYLDDTAMPSYLKQKYEEMEWSFRQWYLRVRYQTQKLELKV